jgi:hypothetical protein
VRVLERETQTDEPLERSGLTLGRLWSTAHELLCRFGYREDPADPPNVLVLGGFRRLADPSPLEWSAFFRVAAEWVHVLLVEGPVDPGAPPDLLLPRLFRRPCPRDATPWDLSNALRRRVEQFGVDGRAHVGPFTLFAAPVYAQRDAWPLEPVRVLATSAWLALWRGRRHAPLGVSVALRRVRSRIEQDLLAGGAVSELAELVRVAVLEAVFLSHLESPSDLAPAVLDPLLDHATQTLDPSKRAPTTLGPSLEPAGAEEAVVQQLERGDDDTFVELTRAATSFTDAQRVRLIVHRLGHEALRGLLRPYGCLSAVAPLLTTLTESDVLPKIELSLRAALAEGVALALTFPSPASGRG